MRHTAARIGQHFGGFKKDAGADNDANYHGNSRQQAVSLFQLGFHYNHSLSFFLFFIKMLKKQKMIYSLFITDMKAYVNKL
ncbi:hypothetical protein SDC9_168763 [bioreactor metagenome]|uniref:Uncharacterized protein n=1 Tax=bioreactor metagenome TaxID=1076179 RepID=A0A645GBF4_9ZZZZ